MRVVVCPDCEKEVPLNDEADVACTPAVEYAVSIQHTSTQAQGPIVTQTT